MPPRWPHIERRDQQKALLDLFTGGERSGAVIAGGPGAGRTSLARAALGEMGRAPRRCAWIVGTDRAGAVATLLPAACDPGRGVARPVSVAEILDAVTGHGGDDRAVIGVDDAHLLDEPSAALVHRHLLAGRAFAVLTLRSGAPAPPSVTALWKDGLAERVELPPLTGTDVHVLLEAALAGRVDTHAAAALDRLGAGNGHVLRELVTAALAGGDLAREDGCWVLRRPPTISERLTDLVEGTLGDLPAGTRSVVDAVAVGDPIELATLAVLCDADALDDAVRRGLIAVERSGRRRVARVVGPVVGEVVRRRLGPMAAQLLRRDLSERFGATGMRRGGDAERFATWRLDAGLGAGVDRLVQAGSRALERGDAAAASRFARAAADACRSSGGPSVGVAACALLRARLAVRELRADAARRSLASVDRRVLTGEQAVQAAELAATLRFLDGDPSDAGACLAAAEEAVDAPALVARLRYGRAQVAGLLGLPLDALDALDALDLALAGGTASGSAAGALDAMVRGPALVHAGRYADAAAIAGRPGPDGPVMLDLAGAVPWHETGPVLIALGRGRLDEAGDLAGRLHERGLDSSPARRRAGAALAGWARVHAGDLAGAIRLCAEAVRDDSWLANEELRTLAFAGLAAAHAQAGDVDAATDAVRRWAGGRRTPVCAFDPLIAIARCLVAARRGEPADATRILDDALSFAQDSGLHTAELWLAANGCRAGAPDLAARSLRRLRGVVQSPVVPLLLDQADATVAGDPHRLLDVAARLDAAGFVLGAAESAFAAARRLAGSDRRASSTALGSARRFAQRCTGIDLGGLDPAELSGLTPREVEVARLAASGRMSAAIASDLFISVRTVDTHLSRIYVKLGVAGRADLAHVPELR